MEKLIYKKKKKKKIICYTYFFFLGSDIIKNSFKEHTSIRVMMQWMFKDSICQIFLLSALKGK